MVFIFNKKNDLNSRNFKVKLNDQLIVTISTWAISLTHYSSQIAMQPWIDGQ